MDLLLQQTPLSDLVAKQKVVSIDHAATVGECLKTLAAHNLLSAPVVMEPDLEDAITSEASGSTQVIGWVDVAGVLAAFLEQLRRNRSQETPSMMALMQALEEEGPAFAQKPLITVLSTDEDRDFLYTADGTTTSVASCITSLFFQRQADGNEKVVHRVALFDAHGEITTIISQMDIIKWVVAHADSLGAAANESIQSVGLLQGKRAVLTVSAISPTILALDSMVRGNASGAPVLADNGDAFANLSISDVRALTPEHFSVLALPVGEFLALEHGVKYVGYEASGDSSHPFFTRPGRHGMGATDAGIDLVSITPSTTLINTLRNFVARNVHRLYVVGAEGSRKVEAVVTLTDILRFLASAASSSD